VAEHLETPWRLEYDRLLWHHDDPDGLARAIHGVVDHWPIPDRELLREVRIPTLIVCIGDDELHPVALGHIFEELMPNAELIEFANQGELVGQIPSLVARVSAFIAG
jgi:pimeloyl-ACP methyl ester carboxylesterase